MVIKNIFKLINIYLMYILILQQRSRQFETNDPIFIRWATALIPSMYATIALILVLIGNGKFKYTL